MPLSEKKMMTSNTASALAMLEELATGTLDKARFTGDASWWAVTGESFPLDAFLDLLGVLHAKTIGGIVITTGLVMAEGDHVVIEGTSNVPLTDGGVYANRYLFLILFRAGRIRQVREYNDHAHVVEAFRL